MVSDIYTPEDWSDHLVQLVDIDDYRKLSGDEIIPGKTGNDA